jgi:hypothetical protein
MTTITTKYSVGDRVWHGWTTTERKQHPCPDCLGQRKWQAKSPAGGEFEFSCPRCASSYHGNRDLSLDYTMHTAAVTPLTVGSVGFETNYQTGQLEPRYMCNETGIGSGTVYYERDLYPTEDEARRAADTRAKINNADPEGWVAKQYFLSLSVCDYQLQSAVLEAAKNDQARRESRLWSLFSDLDYAETIDEVRKTIEEFREKGAS